MRIGVAGGGPAGLYAALLIGRYHEVEIFERNPEGATYGWGVVFSEDTLSYLADDEVGEALDRELIRWSTITVHRPDGVTRVSGQPFTAVNRRALLEVLTTQLRRRGIEPRFERELMPSEAASFDLVIAADGVNSHWRRSRVDRFQTQVTAHPTRYIWLGLERSLPGFTFVFRPTPLGVFQVHAYPYGPSQSTFIVETTDEAFAGAGLESADEFASIAFCQNLFEEFLDGAPLLSNRSQWLRFLTLRNRSWFDLQGTPTVLIGDAAHTAHFSIGSGTKLAMEDASALAAALEAHGDDLSAALASYQSKRQPTVARFQEAALDSSRYFETLGELLELPPTEFAVNLLTRSGRVPFSAVERGDPALAAAAGLSPALRPIRIGPERFENRLIGGAIGLGISPPLPVSALGRRHPGEILARDADGDWPVAVLSHAGPRGSNRAPEDGLDRPLRRLSEPLVAASAIPYTARHPEPRALEQPEMDEVAGDFAQSAKAMPKSTRLILIDGAQGGLLACFISPLTNRRSDSYGGSIEGRMRFPLTVVEAVRQEWKGALGFRLSVTDLAKGGLQPDEALAAARLLSLVDLIEVCGFGAVAEVDWPNRPDYLLPMATRVRLATEIPVLVRAGIRTLDEANTVVAAGRADLVRLGR